MTRILVADDNRQLVEMLRAMLEDAGYDVVSASSGLAASALLDKEEVDLLILDVLMPGMSGFELLPALRSIDGMQDLPAIFLSGRVEEHHIRTGRSMGAVYLTKPFSANALTKTIEKLEQRGVAAAPVGW